MNETQGSDQPVGLSRVALPFGTPSVLMSLADEILESDEAVYPKELSFLGDGFDLVGLKIDWEKQ